jgi:hypothetical protein
MNPSRFFFLSWDLVVDGYLVEPEVDEGVAGDVGHGQDVAHEEEGGGVPGGGARITTPSC